MAGEGDTRAKDHRNRAGEDAGGGGSTRQGAAADQGGAGPGGGAGRDADEARFVAQLDRWLQDHRQEMVAAVQALCRIRSVQDEPAPGQPFGPGVAEALEWVRRRAEALGFRTRNVDGYAIDAEIGEGDEWIAILAHVDVVPEGSGWTHPPYAAEIHDGKIYARGAVDDKGPTVAALYAMKAVADLALAAGRRPARRARLVVGGNEESGFECVKYYFAREPQPALGFSPDAMFPLVHAEKGIWTFRLSLELPGGGADSLDEPADGAAGALEEAASGRAASAGAPARVAPGVPAAEGATDSGAGGESGRGGVPRAGREAEGAADGPGAGAAPRPRWRARLVRLEGGTRVNVVPEHAVAELVVAGPGAPSLEELARRLQDGGGPGRARIEARVADDRLVVEARGAAAHAMHPEKGINAVAGLLGALVRVLGPALPRSSDLGFLAEAGARTDGSGFGIAVTDAVSGPLTVNLGIVRLVGTDDEAAAGSSPAPRAEASAAGAASSRARGGGAVIYADCNVRYPVTTSAAQLLQRLTATLADSGWRVESREDMPPHHVPEHSEIVQQLLAVYRDETGDRDARPLAIGGGTYARVLRNGVAFGPLFPGQRELAHEPDEHWSIDDLMRCTRIYARAIYRLMFAPGR